MQKIRIAILCGGQSAEHEISIRSARNIINALDKNRFDIHIISIDKKGEWHLENSLQTLLMDNQSGENLGLLPGKKNELFVDATQHKTLPEIDVVFPVLHGPQGEDGTVQGLLKLANIPFVGSDVLGSAICMDKDVSKRLMRDAGLPISQFLVYHRKEKASIQFSTLVKQLGLPFFVKPANLGSSIGISKVANEHAFEKAIDLAFTYDHKIIIEEYIQSREIECSILGNEDPIASIPGEIVPHLEFYSYEAKYLNDQGASMKIPADLPQDGIKYIQELSIKAFEILGCSGMARVDFFYTPNHKIYINEINTIPGFTNTSMYPQLWEASGISYAALIERLIQLAFEKFEQQQSLKTYLELPIHQPS
ncbi:MAG: D-alanine--D-alanine ligase A [Legionellaceae bacterium]